MPKLPPVIKWENKEIATQLLGTIHTHPDQSPLSIADMMSFIYESSGAFSVVSTSSYNLMLIKTQPVPLPSLPPEYRSSEMEKKYLNDRAGQPNWKHRYLGIRDVMHEQRWLQAAYEMSHEFCKTYKIGLYGGKPAKPLTRLV